MAYIGPEPNPGQNREVDDISSGFNGGTASFTLQVNGQNVSPGSANAIIVSLGGVIQNPGTDYTVAASTITFTTNPASGLSFFGLVLGQQVDTEGTADGSITLNKFINGTSSNDGKFLRANNGAAPSFETVSAGTSLSGSTNNTITTVTGASAIQGEANLTFDGTILTITGSNEADMLHFTTGNSAGNTFAGIRGDNESGIKIRGGGSFDGGTIELGGGLRDTNPGIIAFSTGTGTSSSERMRIGNDGFVGIGVTTAVANGGGACFVNGDSGRNYLILGCNTSGTKSLIEFNNSNFKVGSIETSGTSTAYNTSSDYRLKENAVAIDDGITRLKTLKPYKFNFKNDSSTKVDGFFAHEVTAVPEAISGAKDEVDSDNNPVYQGIDQSKLVPLLTAALQEAVTKIEVLETKVAALEAA